jgi:hypothetical protein
MLAAVGIMLWASAMSFCRSPSRRDGHRRRRASSAGGRAARRAAGARCRGARGGVGDEAADGSTRGSRPCGIRRLRPQSRCLPNGVRSASIRGGPGIRKDSETRDVSVRRRIPVPFRGNRVPYPHESGGAPHESGSVPDFSGGRKPNPLGRLQDSGHETRRKMKGIETSFI